MKITKARLKKAIKEAMEGATPDAQLTEIFGLSRGEKEKKRHDALVKATPCTAFDSLQDLHDWATEYFWTGAPAKRLEKRAQENGWETELKIIDTVRTQILQTGPGGRGTNMRTEKGHNGEYYVVAYRFGDKSDYTPVCEPQLRDLYFTLQRGQFTDSVERGRERREQSAMQEGKTKTKITKSQLKKVIQEEVEKAILDEGFMSTLKKGARKMRGKGMMASDATKRSQERAHEMVKYLEQVALASYQNATGGGTGPSPEDALKTIQARANQLVDASPGGHKIANQLGELVVGLAKSASNLAINAANEGQKIKFDQLQAKLAQRVPGKGTSLAAKLAEKYVQVLDAGGSWGTS